MQVMCASETESIYFTPVVDLNLLFWEMRSEKALNHSEKKVQTKRGQRYFCKGRGACFSCPAFIQDGTKLPYLH